MQLCVRGTDFSSFDILFFNCSDSVVFVFHFIYALVFYFPKLLER